MDADSAMPMGEGGQVAANGLCTREPCGRKPVAIIGGTGYVGRLLSRRLLTHPTFCLGPIVGSKRSEGMVFQDVWEEKEAALMKNYGRELWTAMPFPPALAGVTVSSLESLLESDCKIAISCVAPDVGYIEDILTNHGMKVYSISPYKRSENLTVPEVNPAQIPSAIDKSLFKSPNCVSVGTSLALKAIDDAFGLKRVSVCTFQSLSGRGDAMYPAELVQGNIYPVWNTKERTEVYIGNEICALVNVPPEELTVRAHRVGVHIGHFVDVRVSVRCPELLTSPDAVYRAFEGFAPLKDLYGPEMPSLPQQPLKVMREVGAPRPATHNMEFGGMQVAVGNVKLEDGVWDVCFSAVVNNMIRGAYGAALLMAEYHLYLQAHPEVAQKLLKQHGQFDSSHPISAQPVGQRSPASVLGSSVALPAPVPVARANKLTSAKLVSESRQSCELDAGAYHAEIAKRNLHWFHPKLGAWLSWDEAVSEWRGWRALDGSATSLDDGGWTPWDVTLDDGKAPYFEWFVGAQTNAAFNEVDRHVLGGHGDETAFISVGPTALEAAMGGESIREHSASLTRKELLTSSAINAAILKEVGVGPGETVVMLLPHCLEQICWIEACKRIGAVYTCLPESISVASLAGRAFDLSAKVVITSHTKSSVDGTSHKAMVSAAVMDYVSMEAALRAIRRVLPEQRWRSQSGKVDIKAVCDALEASFKGEGAVSPKEVASKLEIVFSMNPPLKEKAMALAVYVMDEMRREHAARVKTKLLVVPPPFAKTSSLQSTTPPDSVSPSVPRRSVDASNGKDGSQSFRNLLAAGGTKYTKEAAETSAQLGALVVSADEVHVRVVSSFLAAAGVSTYSELLCLPDDVLVAAVWKVLPCTPLPSMHPKNVVYTSGSSGNKATGLVQDTGGYTSGVANTMPAVFDAVGGVDVIFTDAAPSWVTGQTYGITGPLTTRVTSVLVTGMAEATMAQSLAAVVRELHVSIFVASASFLKRALKTTWQASWLQRQRLNEHLRVAASCGEPLSPAMHKLGMATLTPNYINSYWASEHGSIVLARAFGNADQPGHGDASMHPMPWVNAEVWLPVGEANDDGRVRFRKSEVEEMAPGGPPSPGASSPSRRGSVPAEGEGGIKGRLIVTRPWPSMARTVWGDAELAASAGWVGDLDAYHDTYWSTFCAEDGEPVLALDLADLARPWSDGSFSVLGHSREELRLGPARVVIAAAELEAIMLASSPDVIDALVVALPDLGGHGSLFGKKVSIPIVCLVLPEGVELTEEMANDLKKAAHEALGESCVPADFVRIPAIPRTHNAKPMRNVVQRLFQAASSVNDVSEIANPACLLELKAAIDQWRFEQATPVLDERC